MARRVVGVGREILGALVPSVQDSDGKVTWRKEGEEWGRTTGVGDRGRSTPACVDQLLWDT